MVLNYHVKICTLAQVFFFLINQKLNYEDLAFKAYGEGTMSVRAFGVLGVWWCKCVQCVLVCGVVCVWWCKCVHRMLQR